MCSDLAQTVRNKAALVFDLFHTLTPRESLIAAGAPMTHEVLGVPQEAWHVQLMERSRERLIGTLRDPYAIMRRLAHGIAPSISEETIVHATDRRIERFATVLRHIPQENVEALRSLRRAGKKLALVSNADAMEVAGWNESPIVDMFDATLLSCEVGWAKPDPEIFDMCLERLGLPARECIFVGDGGSGELKAARACGMTTVMVAGVIREIWPDQIETRRQDADYAVESVAELNPE